MFNNEQIPPDILKEIIKEDHTYFENAVKTQLFISLDIIKKFFDFISNDIRIEIIKKFELNLDFYKEIFKKYPKLSIHLIEHKRIDIELILKNIDNIDSKSIIKFQPIWNFIANTYDISYDKLFLISKFMKWNDFVYAQKEKQMKKNRNYRSISYCDFNTVDGILIIPQDKDITVIESKKYSYLNTINIYIYKRLYKPCRQLLTNIWKKFC